MLEDRKVPFAYFPSVLLGIGSAVAFIASVVVLNLYLPAWSGFNAKSPLALIWPLLSVAVGLLSLAMFCITVRRKKIASFEVGWGTVIFHGVFTVVVVALLRVVGSVWFHLYAL